MPRKQPETNRKRPGAVWLDAPTAAIERGNDTPSRGREVLPLNTGATCNLWPLPPGTKQRCRPLQGPPSVEHECASHPFRESKSYRRSAQETCNFQAETSTGLTPFGPTAALAALDLITIALTPPWVRSRNTAQRLLLPMSRAGVKTNRRTDQARPFTSRPSGNPAPTPPLCLVQPSG